MTSKRLDELRSEIRALDGKLVKLVGRRRELVLEIGRAKLELNLPVLDPAQEAEVVRRAAVRARAAGVDEELMRDILWRIIASARDEQDGRTRWGPPLEAEVEEGQACRDMLQRAEEVRQDNSPQSQSQASKSEKAKAGEAQKVGQVSGPMAGDSQGSKTAYQLPNAGATDGGSGTNAVAPPPRPSPEAEK